MSFDRTYTKNLQQSITAAMAVSSVKVTQTQTVTLDCFDYHIVPYGKLPEDFTISSPIEALTLVHLPTGGIEVPTTTYFVNQIKKWLSTDDVLSASFLEHVLVFTESDQGQQQVDDICNALKAICNTKECKMAAQRLFSTGLPQGPYFLLGDRLYKPFKLQDDI